ETCEIKPGTLKRMPSHFTKTVVAQLAKIFAIQPGAFFQIEGRVFPKHFRQIENANDLGQVELLPVVLRRPAEQAEKITDSFRQITVLYISDEARALVALAHLRAIQLQDKWDVSETRRRDAQGPINLNVFRRGRQMVLAPDHVGDSHPH